MVSQIISSIYKSNIMKQLYSALLGVILLSRQQLWILSEKYVYLNLRTICYYGIFFPYWNQSGSDMIIKFFYSFVVEIRSRNFNSLKVLNYRQIEKRILDRILSPSIYDNQIRNFRQLYAAINKIWGQISADQSIFENRFFQSFLHSNYVFDIYNQNCKYVSS